jgi:ribonuclease D
LSATSNTNMDGAPWWWRRGRRGVAPFGRRRHTIEAVIASVCVGDLSADDRDALLQEEFVAVDTETSGLDWRSDSLALCQLFSPRTGAVLVQMTYRSAPNLVTVLSAPSVTKVLHFAPFDLQFLGSALGVIPAPVRCTKAAAKLLYPGADPRDHSPGALLREHLGISLDKGAVRVSDWRARVLTDKQIAYAAGDVEHLLNLFDLLNEKIERAGMSAIYDAISRYMPVAAQMTLMGVPDPLSY